jgi:hypothetical protein
MGLGVPQVVLVLLGQGLSPATATAVMDRVLGDQIRQQLKPPARAERRNRWHRILSGAAACACVLVAYWFFGTWAACRTAIGLPLPVVCIWFPDEVGGFASRYSPIVTPLGIFVRWGGWLIMVLTGTVLLWLGLALQGN